MGIIGDGRKLGREALEVLGGLEGNFHRLALSVRLCFDLPVVGLNLM